MALSDKDKQRINLMNPVSNDLKLGDKLAELEENAGGDIDAYTKSEADSKFQPKGNYASKDDSYTKTESDNKYQEKGTYATKAELDAAIEDLQEQIDALGGDGS